MIATKLDFRGCPVPQGARILATNPPFNLHSSFVARGTALLDAGKLDVAVLLFWHDHLQSEPRAKSDPADARGNAAGLR